MTGTKLFRSTEAPNNSRYPAASARAPRPNIRIDVL